MTSIILLYNEYKNWRSVQYSSHYGGTVSVRCRSSSVDPPSLGMGRLRWLRRLLWLLQLLWLRWLRRLGLVNSLPFFLFFNFINREFHTSRAYHRLSRY